MLGFLMSVSVELHNFGGIIKKDAFYFAQRKNNSNFVILLILVHIFCSAM